MGAAGSCRSWPALAGIAVLTLAGCGGRDLTPQVSMQIRQLTAAAPASPVSKAVWADVQRFYALRMHAPRWLRAGLVSTTRIEKGT